jgi:8-oxo-dGTP pyrophosphatase MutT (NUDIX family)
METTRHFVATMYVVNDGATLLHEHEKLGMWLPPGGHIDRDEQPHEAALRETYEETGLEPELVAEVTDYAFETPEDPTTAQGWNKGYLMGWSNPNYGEETEFLVDEFALSTAPLLEGVDPE